MQYWKNFKNSKVERVESEQLKKHPELEQVYLRQGFVRIVSEEDDSLFEEQKKQKKKRKKKVKK
tara:strand:+ start:50 stop:241 length:192 start_codon:yes stop_codon:yes gene_type:complete